MCSHRVTRYRDMVFSVHPQVYEPAEDTFLLLESLDVTAEDTVLEIGTGCGIVAVTAARQAKGVVAVDVNPLAVRCAKLNAEANGVQAKLSIRHGSMFEPVRRDERFSVIVFNAPYLPKENHEDADWLDKAWSGGVDGRLLIDQFIEAAPRFLVLGGRVFLVQSSLANVDKTLSKFRALGFQARVVAEQAFFFEKIVVIRAEQER